MRALQTRTARATPFYYGWIILGLSGVVSYSARPLMSVAVLTVFVVPMSEQFGWTRAELAGAVCLGGVFAAVVSPMVGLVLDRYGSGMVVGVFSAIAGACAVALGAVTQIWMFYVVYVAGAHGVLRPAGAGNVGGGQQLVRPAASVRIGAEPYIAGFGPGGHALGGAGDHRRLGMGRGVVHPGHLDGGGGRDSGDAADGAASGRLGPGTGWRRGFGAVRLRWIGPASAVCDRRNQLHAAPGDADAGRSG